MKRQAWYSSTQHRVTASVYWSREDGTEVEVTEVTEVGKRPSGERFGVTDFEDRGEVVRWVRDGRPRQDGLIEEGPYYH